MTELRLASRSLDFSGLDLSARAPCLPGGNLACKCDKREQSALTDGSGLARGGTGCVGTPGGGLQNPPEGQEPESRCSAWHGMGEMARNQLGPRLELKYEQKRNSQEHSRSQMRKSGHKYERPAEFQSTPLQLGEKKPSRTRTETRL